MKVIEVQLERADPKEADRQNQTFSLERDLFVRIALAVIQVACTDGSGSLHESGDEWNFHVEEKVVRSGGRHV